MIASTDEKYTFSDIGAPKVIASDTQHEEYVSVLLELSRKKNIPRPPEKNLCGTAVVLLIEAYEEKHHAVTRPHSPVEVLQELLRSQ